MRKESTPSRCPLTGAKLTQSPKICPNSDCTGPTVSLPTSRSTIAHRSRAVAELYDMNPWPCSSASPRRRRYSALNSRRPPPTRITSRCCSIRCAPFSARDRATSSGVNVARSEAAERARNAGRAGIPVCAMMISMRGLRYLLIAASLGMASFLVYIFATELLALLSQASLPPVC